MGAHQLAAQGPDICDKHSSGLQTVALQCHVFWCTPCWQVEHLIELYLHIDCNMYKDIYQSLWWHQGLHFRSWALSRPYWPSNPFAPTWSSRPLLWRGIPQVSHLWWLSHQSRGAPRDYLFEIPMKVPGWRAEDWQQNLIATHPNLQLPTELCFHFNFQKTNHTELGRDNQLEIEAE